LRLTDIDTRLREKDIFIESRATSAVFIAEPTTMILVGLGGLALLKKRKA